MENPLAVANYFIQKSFDTGKELTPMKLVKLVYIAHGWHLALAGKPLINEAVQAWKYGPVIQTVYTAFSQYGKDQITRLYGSPGVNDQVFINLSDPGIVSFLDKIWDVHKDHNGLQLSTLTHTVNTPWDIVFNKQGGKDKVSAIIPNELIKAHYKQKVDANRQEADNARTA